MQLTLLNGYPDFIGKRKAFVGYGTGPASYVQFTTAGAGDAVLGLPFGNYIDSVYPTVSVSGTYAVYPIPIGTGPRLTWVLKWVTLSTGAEVSAATNLSAEKVQLGGFCGQY